MDFLDYLYLKLRRNFLMGINGITNHDFHLKKVPYQEDRVYDFVAYIIQPCDFKYEKDRFPVLITIDYKMDTMLELIQTLIDGASSEEVKDFGKELINIAVGGLKAQVSKDHYQFEMAIPDTAKERNLIPQYQRFIPLEDSYVVASAQGIFGCLSFYFEEE